MAEENKNIEKLKAEEPHVAQRKEDWIKWRTGTHGFPPDVPAHVLGLYRDINRSRTNIVFYSAKYTPESKDVNHKFTIDGVGVFKVVDVLDVLEGIMGLDKGEGKEYVDGMLEEMDALSRDLPIIPMLYFLFNLDGEVGAWLGSAAIHLEQLQRMTHDPEWRKFINKDDPPGKVVLINGIEDQEDIF